VDSGHGRTYYARRIGETESVFVLKDLIRQTDVERRARLVREVDALNRLEARRGTLLLTA
jgi:hypothetical protein